MHTRSPSRPELSNKTTEVLFDVGCNKGYESTLMFQLFSPASQLAPEDAHKVHEEQGRGLHGNLCGACDNCQERLEANRDPSLPVPDVHIYCFEVGLLVRLWWLYECALAQHPPITQPSLTNFGNVLNVRNKFEDQLAKSNASWHLINSAVGPHVSLVKFPRSCGTTLCQVSDKVLGMWSTCKRSSSSTSCNDFAQGDSTNENGPTYEAIFMTSVDAFAEAEGLQHIDVLKIDTEVCRVVQWLHVHHCHQTE